jgi:hypothetical protein
MIADSLGSTVGCWRVALAAQSMRMPAHALYAGRSFSEAKLAASRIDGCLYVVSAGLGVVAANDQVPHYDLTAAGSGGGLNAALAIHAAQPSDWWNVLCAGLGLAQLIRENAGSLVLMALPSTYMRMVAADLARCSTRDLQRVRLFTSLVGRSALPVAVADSAMPYDERLESLPAYAGTRADFPQRALRHFVERLEGHRLAMPEARQAVDKALSTCALRQLARRVRMDDEEIRNLICAHWTVCEGHSSRLLRYIRDEAHVACEQGRFARLWREVRDERLARSAQHEGDEYAITP